MLWPNDKRIQFNVSTSTAPTPLVPYENMFKTGVFRANEC